MTFKQWLYKVFGPRVQVSRSSRRGKPRQPSRHRYVPTLELLEGRLAPSVNTITVMGTTALGDAAVTPLSGSGTTWTAANLRSAVSGAEGLTGSDQIVFDPSLFSSSAQTIDLTMVGDTSVGRSALQINKNANITITGPSGNYGLTLVADPLPSTEMRLFDVTAGATLTLENLTLSGGDAQGFAGANATGGGAGGGSAGLGGAIFNQGSLTILNSTLTGNTALGGAGGSFAMTGDGNGGGGAGLGGIGGADGPDHGGAGGPPNGGAGGQYPGTPSGSNGSGFGGGGGGGCGDKSNFATYAPGGSGNFGGGGGGGAYYNGNGGSPGGSGGFGGGGGGGGSGPGGADGGSGGYGGGPGSFGSGQGDGTGAGGGGAGMGGAIFNEAGTVVITNSTITANTTQGGAGGTGDVSSYDGTAGQGLGGGLFNHNGTITVLNSTFSANTANQGGGSIFNLGDGTGQTATLTLTSSILANTPSGVADFQAAVVNGGGLSMSGTTNLIVSPGQTGTGPSGGALYPLGSAAVGDAGFETPNKGTGFQFNPSGTPWTFSGASPSGSGVAGNGSALTSSNPNAPEGTQVGFIEETGSISQQSVPFTAGTYTINFQAAQRALGGGPSDTQNFEVMVDTTVVGTFTPSSTSYASYSTNPFPVTAGAHTITFVGLDTNGGDNTAFIDQVTVLGGNLVGVDPLLAGLASNGGPTQTMALMPGSPAIDQGTKAGAPAADQRGLPRDSDNAGTVDIGAFETQSQTITFSPLAGVTYGHADFAISATATSGLPVSFTASGNASVQQVAGVWYVHISAAGSATITAQQAGDAGYNPAPDVAQGLTIAKATATVVVTPYTSASTTYDGLAHTATVTSITGVNGETGATVGSVDVSNTTHTSAGIYASDSWSFTGTANYNDIGSTTITDSIARAHLTVTADNTIWFVGSSMPTLTATLSGFVHNEGPDVVSGSPTLSTTATVSSPVGNYPISVVDAGTLSAANYDFPANRFVGANLTVVVPLPNGTETFTDTDGDRYVVKLVGPGQVGVLLNGPDAPEMGSIDTIFLAGTDPTKSTLSITVKKANDLVNLGDVQGSGLKSLVASACDLVGGGINNNGGINLSGLLGSLKIHDILTGAGIFAQGTANQKTTLVAHVINDGTTIALGSSITSLKAALFGQGSLTAPSLGTLKITGDRAHGIPGDFAADVTLSGPGVAAGKPVLGTVVIAGTVSGATLNVAGSVKSFQAGAFSNSQLYLGFDPTPGGNLLAGVFSPGSSFTLGSFKVIGLTGSTAQAFVNSVIAASTVTTVSLKSAQTSNNNNPFGVIGHTVGSVKILLPKPGFIWTNTHQVATPGDFRVDII